ncbi:MAG: 3-deoxy-manno-octulosonate cytidylyltransferase [Deltaproteobacteria bacterium]|nr:3-deoxy-manno-octulosonate cytidylyltransferase [Deltaproteobacteria bacterium]
MKVIGVIPSRLGSTRLPEKPLKDIDGKTLVQRVWDAASQARSLTECVIATDSDEILRHVESFGGRAVMTSPDHGTGSERVLAAARLAASPEGKPGAENQWDLILNIQGDMPLLPPSVIDRLVGFLAERRGDFQMATIATPIESEEQFLSRSVVKVVISARGEGLYFSRAPIPFPRDEDGKRTLAAPTADGFAYGFKHLGLYAFTPQALLAYEKPDFTPLEKVEKLEQLRVLEHGNRIGVLPIESQTLSESVEVDTPEDLARAAEIFRRRRG